MEYRIIVMGAEGVGKTSLIRQYLHGTFPSYHNHTLEDLHKRSTRLSDGSWTDVDILDTSGSKEDRTLVQTNLQLGDAFMLVYAVDSRRSFCEALKLADEIVLLKRKNVPIVLVGNKSDSFRTETVSRHEALYNVNGKQNMSYLETSAKTNFRVEKAFERLLPLQDNCELRKCQVSNRKKRQVLSSFFDKLGVIFRSR